MRQAFGFDLSESRSVVHVSTPDSVTRNIYDLNNRGNASTYAVSVLMSLLPNCNCVLLVWYLRC